MASVIFMAAVFMVAAGWYGYVDGEAVNFSTLFTFYSFSVVFLYANIGIDKFGSLYRTG